MIIDTHCHYNLEPLTTQWEINWQAAQEHGVRGAIVVGTNLESSKLGLGIVAEQPHLFASLGIHPSEATELQASGASFDGVVGEIRSLIASQPDKVVAIGECGLDYFRFKKTVDNTAEISAQKQLARLQIQLAGELQLPLIVHLRDKEEDAYTDFLELFLEVDPKVTPILHCVSGPINWLRSMLELGAYIGVAGNVSYRSADHIRELVQATDPDRVLLETDAPFLPPQGHRGKVCEPWMIEETAQFVSDQLGLQADRIINNTLSVFPQFSASVRNTA